MLHMHDKWPIYYICYKKYRANYLRKLNNSETHLSVIGYFLDLLNNKLFL